MKSKQDSKSGNLKADKMLNEFLILAMTYNFCLPAITWLFMQLCYYG